MSPNIEQEQALRPGEGQMLSFNLTGEIQRLKAKAEWETRDRIAASLVKDRALNVVLMLLKERARLSEHRTRGPIALQVIYGSVKFLTQQAELILSAGDVVALDRDISHSLEAAAESAVLLTTVIE